MKILAAQLRIVSLLGLILLLWTSAYAQVTPSQDSFTNTSAATTNYGANVLLDVDGAKEITYIQFNLASIPSGASVSQATLKLYVNAVTTAGSFNVDYVNGTWEESTLDANNAPPLGASIASSVSITTADKNQYILINVTSALQAWLNGGETNDGLALVANGSFNASFDSKESKTTSHPPELDVVFAGSGGGITGIDTASGSGLIGGGTSGTLNLSLTNTCATSQVLQWNGTSWLCASVGTGTITGVIAGTDLTGGGTSGNVTLNLNTSATNALYAQLAAANTFSGVQTINNTTFITGANSSGVLEVTNTLSSGSAPAVVGTTNSTNASGLKGIASATSGTSTGVYGTNSSGGGYG
ncbi:MAG: DNRLRE domain-containing protein, partial [Terriglobales bacterium]